MSEDCRNCKPENGECSFCPNSSVGKINIRDIGGPCNADNIDNCPTFFGINIENASLDVQEIIHKCIEKEKHPNY